MPIKARTKAVSGVQINLPVSLLISTLRKKSSEAALDSFEPGFRIDRDQPEQQIRPEVLL